MTLPVYVLSDLTLISGRDASFYTNTAFVTQAIAEATLLFSLATNRTEMPDQPQMVQLAKYGILSMADAIYLVQPFQEQIAQPFNSETIGSYSYSRLQSAALGGLPTGISWFDTAVKFLNLGRPTDLVFGGIEALEHDATYAKGSIGANRKLKSPRKRVQRAPQPERWIQPVEIISGNGGPTEGNPLDGWQPDPSDPGFLLYGDDE